ncbi:MAG: hypothetical protein P4L40_20200 [Terracidiphilus sp.]|nr:hypothetical protein [Terracidiphilus sp.]
MTTPSNAATEELARQRQILEFVASSSAPYSCAEADFTSELIQVSVVY